MPPDWLTEVGDPLAVPLTAVAVYAAVILSTRLNGLRSFSTMSAFDFAITVATGTLVASTVLDPRLSVAEGLLGLVSLLLLQRTVSFLRRWRRLERVIDNSPLLLVHRGKVLRENLRRCHMVEGDLHARVRAAGLLRVGDVELAVMETTGNVSIVPRREGVEADERLLRDVRT